MRRWLLLVMTLATLPRGVGWADEDLSRYYQELRRRGLYTLAESHAVNHLADPRLAPARRSAYVLELARTYAEHTLYAPVDEQPQLWSQALAVLTEEEQQPGNLERRPIYEAERALLLAWRARQSAIEALLIPTDQGLQQQAIQESAEALVALRKLDDDWLAKAKRTAAATKASFPTANDLRVLVNHSRFQQAGLLLARGELSPSAAPERIADILEAETALKKIITPTDDPLVLHIKALLLVSQRLRQDLPRMGQLLQQLDAGPPLPLDIQDAVLTERVRWLMAEQKPDQALRELQKYRVSRAGRMTGEQWLCQLQALSVLRQLAARKENAELQAEIVHQGERTLTQLDQQIGGAWSRRGRIVWTNSHPEGRQQQALERTLRSAQQAVQRGELADARTHYQLALDQTEKLGQPEVVAKVAYALGGVEYRAGHFAEAAKAFQKARQALGQVVVPPAPPPAPASTAVPSPAEVLTGISSGGRVQLPSDAELELLAAYCLGRVYDQRPTSTSETEYRQALDRVISEFPKSDVAAEAVYSRGRLFERRQEWEAARENYQQVPGEHPRGWEARAAIARCLVAEIEQPLADRPTVGAAAPAPDRIYAAILTLRDWVRQLPSVPAQWDPAAGEIALRYGQLLLRGDGEDQRSAAVWLERVRTGGTQSPRPRPDGSVSIGDARPGDSAPLEESSAAGEREHSEIAMAAARWQELRRRAIGPLIVARTLRGERGTALTLIQELATVTPRDLLRVLDDLAAMDRPAAPESNAGPANSTGRPGTSSRPHSGTTLSAALVSELRLTVAEALEKAEQEGRAKLSAGELRRVQVEQARGLCRTGATAKGLALYEQLWERAAKDSGIRRQLAADLAELDLPETRPIVSRWWKQLETSSKSGSPEWLEARLGQIAAEIALDQRDAARKLLAVTKLLYPLTANDPRYQALERNLESSAAPR